MDPPKAHPEKLNGRPGPGSIATNGGVVFRSLAGPRQPPSSTSCVRTPTRLREQWKFEHALFAAETADAGRRGPPRIPVLADYVCDAAINILVVGLLSGPNHPPAQRTRGGSCAGGSLRELEPMQKWRVVDGLRCFEPNWLSLSQDGDGA